MPARFTLTKLPINYQYSNFKPQYNIAPTDQVLVIINNEIKNATFGFVRDFSKTPLINARGENISENKVFKQAFYNNRCIILADSFYEWKEENKNKVPYRILLKNENIFGMAGIYEERNGKTYVAIITCKPNKLVEKIHPRMPVILENDDWNSWLKSPNKDILMPLNADFMDFYEVNPKVNNTQNNDENLIKKVVKKTLFDY